MVVSRCPGNEQQRRFSPLESSLKFFALQFYPLLLNGSTQYCSTTVVSAFAKKSHTCVAQRLCRTKNLLQSQEMPVTNVITGISSLQKYISNVKIVKVLNYKTFAKRGKNEIKYKYFSCSNCKARLMIYLRFFVHHSALALNRKSSGLEWTIYN